MDFDEFMKNFGIVAIVLLPFYVLWLIARFIWKLIFD